MVDFKNIYEGHDSSEGSEGSSNYIEYPEGRYTFAFAGCELLSDMVTQSGANAGKISDRLEFTFEVQEIDSSMRMATQTAQHIISYDKEGVSDPKNHTTAIAGKDCTLAMQMAMGLSLQDAMSGNSDSLIGKSATCLMKNRKYIKADGTEGSVLEIDEGYAGKNWDSVGSQPTVQIPTAEAKPVEQKIEAPVKEETAKFVPDTEVPF
tara:strand:- start:5288 stop:5908 length:621 start_codon:yes stop_codon:yes gene_type:complete